MTEIVLYTDGDGCERGFEVRGHSGFGISGGDPVCAAISVLTITTANSIESLTQDAPRIRADKDRAVISCIFDSPPSDESRLLLKAYALGIGDIVSKYGKYAKLELRRYK